MRFQPELCPEPRWGAHVAPTDTLVGWGGDIPYPTELGAFGESIMSPLGAVGASIWWGIAPKYFSREPTLPRHPYRTLPEHTGGFSIPVNGHKPPDKPLGQNHHPTSEVEGVLT